jgi:hypothetical protein
MPSGEMKKGTILLVFEESFLELGIIRYTAQKPNSRRDV